MKSKKDLTVAGMGSSIRVLICILAILGRYSCMGQALSWTPYFDHITIEDKLSNNTVRCMIQDRHGYIWIGTQNGLNKYDGYSFEVYRSDYDRADQSGFRGRDILSLMEDREGNVWVGTAGSGLNVLPHDSDQFQNLSGDSAFMPISGFPISSIHQGPEGLIWLTTIGGGVLSYDPSNHSSTVYTHSTSHLSSDLTFDLVFDTDGRVWVGAAGLGVNLLRDDGMFSLFPDAEGASPNMAGYRKTLLIQDSVLWVATEGSGLYRMNMDSEEVERIGDAEGLSSQGIMDMHLTVDGQLWLATNGGGLNVMDTESRQISVWRPQPGNPGSLNSGSLLCFLEDRMSNLWIGTFNGGINVYQPNQARFGRIVPGPEVAAGPGNWSVLTIYQRRNGEILIGTDGDGLFAFSQSSTLGQSPSIHDHALSTDLSGQVVKSLLEDREGYLWIGTFSNGLDRYDPATGTWARFRHEFWNPNSLGGNNVWSLAEDQAGRVWIGTLGGGVNVWDPETESFEHFGPDPNNPASISDANVMVVMVDSSDRVWIGTMDRGLDLWTGDGTGFRHFRANIGDTTSISHNGIRAIFQDSRGDIWIGTEGGGLNRWLGEGSFTQIGTDDGLLANSVMGITEDHEGFLWVTTYEGISRIQPETGEIRNFSFRETKRSNQFNQSSVLHSQDHRLLFGGIKGIHTIRPDQVVEKAVEPQITITGFNLYNEEVKAGPWKDGRVILSKPIEHAEKIELNYDDNAFSFSFASTNFNQPSEAVFGYQMENFHTDWQHTDPGQHRVYFTDLEPGEYQFRMTYQGAEASIGLVIHPPFWETGWFKALVALTGILLILGVVIWIINRREAAFRREAFRAKSEILRLNNEKLASEVEAINSKLVYSSVQMAHKNEILNQVKEEIQSIDGKGHAGSRSLIRLINRELKGEDYWKEFTLYFNQTDKAFIQTLSTRHPDLTQNDLRLCALIRLNLSTKEIASLLNITVRGVEQGKYRLKKRLGLSKGDDLNTYISEV